jgi:hypothetical protein
MSEGHVVALWDAEPEGPARAASRIDAVLPDLVSRRRIESESRKRTPADKLVARQAWRNRRLALAAHKRRPD